MPPHNKKKPTRRAPREHAPPRQRSQHAERWLDIKEVAAIFDVSISTVRRLIRRHELPHARLGRQIRITREHVQAYRDKISVNADATSAIL